MNRFKEALLSQSERTSSTRGSIIALVGAYIIYMAFQMLKNTRTGASSMSMRLTVILMAVMIIAGLAVIAYGVFLFWEGWKRERANIPKDEEKGEKQ